MRECARVRASTRVIVQLRMCAYACVRLCAYARVCARVRAFVCVCALVGVSVRECVCLCSNACVCACNCKRAWVHEWLACIRVHVRGSVAVCVRVRLCLCAVCLFLLCAPSNNARLQTFRQKSENCNNSLTNKDKVNFSVRKLDIQAFLLMPSFFYIWC